MNEPREIQFAGVRTERRVVNLADLGFVGRVSDEARAEIEANARRAARVLQTAHRYWFR